MRYRIFTEVLLLSLVLISATASAQRTFRGRDAGLKVGDMAPTFKLKSPDGKTETDLKAFRGKKPVVPIFGSYT